MARYIGPKTKIARRFGEPIFGPDKVLERRPNPPGQHGAKRKRKLSEYGEQLREKQKAKYIYGMLERQFHLFFKRALAKEGKTGELLMQMCESRLDNIVYRLGIAPTRAAARQLVTHRHIVVDGKVLSIPSYIVKAGQTVGVRESNRTMVAIVSSLAAPRVSPSPWLEWDEATMTGTFTRVPERAEIPETVDEQAIVELYSR
ncbi:MAG: 30S ribosomal protein S4 [Kiritimatiellae bacterium]|nr:30S ribosomal protein S4 [Kiritimatiellia bacterium]